MTTQELIEKYPFLQPRNVWTDDIIDEEDYCLIRDDIPDGWWKTFGIALCDDLKDVLVRNNCLDVYRIDQCKEKYGQLRLYDNGTPAEWSDHMWAWEYISEHTCCHCGAFPAKMRNDGWVSPYCDECWSKINDKDCIYDDDGRLREYMCIVTYGMKEGEKYRFIDLKPYYAKIGYEPKDLITKEEMMEHILEK